jgi:RNA polymerase sigma factor (sigma-70 family)
MASGRTSPIIARMGKENTTIEVQRYLQELDGSAPSEPIVRALLQRSAARLQALCATMLVRQYPRLMRPPMNLQAEEMLSAIVERLLNAMRSVHPETPRQFFALANQHMRWELNDLARRLDQRTQVQGLLEDAVPFPDTSGSALSPNATRMLEAIEGLPEEEREVFELIRIQGMTQSETADLLQVSTKTVQRRLNRGLLNLSELLRDLRPSDAEEN